MAEAISSALTEAARTLDATGISDARLDASLLLSHAIDRDRAFIFAHGDENLSPQQLDTFRDFVARRSNGEPLQYIVGHQEFFKLDFEVTPDVLIPRPETELIVERTLDLFQSDAQLRFAEVGTGSGCLAISILHEFQNAHATAIDVSEPALQVAQRNATRHSVIDRLQLIKSDLFAAVSTLDIFDLIISNPPYISDEEMKCLQREVQREPQTALAGGSDGLVVIRRLLSDVPSHLRSGGYLIFEFGINQDRAIRGLVDREVWKLIEVRKDLQQIARTIVLQKQ